MQALDAGADARAQASASSWYEVVSLRPGPEVRDIGMRQRLVESGLPWKVRDRATGIELLLVLPGEFLMGSPAREPGRFQDEGPQHRVRLTQAYYLGAMEVTQAQWQRLMGPFPSFFKGDELPVDPSWDDAQAFLAKANTKSLPGQTLLRLPSEAEWEYACRAGTEGPFGFEGTPDHARINFNDGDVAKAVVVKGELQVEWNTPPAPECPMSSVPAGSLPPNPWGLHEMHGNLMEWCADRYASEAYAERGSLTLDPVVREKGEGQHTLRGGSWYDHARFCRSSARSAGGPTTRSNRIGFRVARSL